MFVGTEDPGLRIRYPLQQGIPETAANPALHFWIARAMARQLSPVDSRLKTLEARFGNKSSLSRACQPIGTTKLSWNGMFGTISRNREFRGSAWLPCIHIL